MRNFAFPEKLKIFHISRNFVFAFRISHFAKFRISHFANCEISHFAFRKMRNFAFRISHFAKFRMRKFAKFRRNFANFRIIFVFAETDFWRFAKTLLKTHSSRSVQVNSYHFFNCILHMLKLNLLFLLQLIHSYYLYQVSNL